MSEVDKRIVEMQFDNKQFESGIATSTKSIDNLKKSLELEGAGKGLSKLEKVANSFSLAGISNSIENLSNKFSTMGIIGITALQNITNNAINAGTRLIKSLTIDPVKTGLDEYETKINAIQTILTNTASKGTTIEDVNKALEELNKYADLTIYDFAEMTRNIGTFTAAGVGLETSTTSIKGIANLAAGSGSSALQASTAMYQLSQAIATGSVKLQDWNSVVNAGMGGELFQKALEKTALELGHGRNMAVSFRESLQDGWITTQVLTKTLEKFANDPALIKAATQIKTLTQLISTMRESVQSGWAQTWEIIIGNKDEATSFFTGINDAFGSVAGASAQARNELLAYWKANEGRTMLLQGISNVLLGISSLLEPIEEAFRDIFPAMTGKRLVEITKAFRDLTSEFKIGSETTSNIKLTFKGLFAVLDIGIKAFKLVGDAIGLIIKALVPGADGLLSITAIIGNFLVYIDDTITKSGVMSTALGKIGVVINYIKDSITKGLTALGPSFHNLQALLLELEINLRDGIGKRLESLGLIANKIGSFLVSLGKSFTEMLTGTTVFASTLTSTKDVFSGTTIESDKLGSSFGKLHSIMSSIYKVVSSVASAIKSVLSPVFDSLKKKFDEFSMQDIGAILTGGGFLILARTLSKVGDIAESFAGILDQVGNTLKAFQLKVKAQALLKVAIAIGILAAALFTLSFIKIEDLAKSLITLTIVFGELVGALIIINKYVKDAAKITTQMVALGIGMLLLANSVRILASIDTGKLIQGTGAIAALMGIVAAFVALTKGGSLKSSAGGLSSFAIGITILSGALFILGKIDTGRLIQGVVAISTLMGVIALFINLTKTGDLSASAGGLVGFSTGIIILSGALSILGKMDSNRLTQGVTALGSLMLMLTIFINLTRGGALAKSSGGLIGFATGIIILSGALSILGKMDTGKLIQGTVAISALIGIIAGFVNLTSGGDLAASAGGLIGFSIGITILSKALSILSQLESGKLIQSTLAMGSLIAIIGIFINITKGGDLAASAAGLIGFSVGIIILSKSVSILASIDSNKIIQGVSSISAIMLGIAAFINLTKEGDLAASAAGLIGFSTGLMVLAGVIAILSSLNTEKLIMATVALSTLIVVITMFVNLTKGGDLAASSAGLIGFSVAIAVMSASMLAIAQLDTGKIIATGAALSVLLLSILAFTALTTGGDLVVSAVGLAIFSGAIMLLSKVIISLGSVDVKTLVIGIGAMAAVLLTLGLTSLILSPLTPIIIGLSAAIALFGVGCLAVGAGMLAFSTGLAMLGTTGQSGATVLISAIKGIVDLIPYILTQIGNGIVGFARVIADGAMTIANSVGSVIESIVKVIANKTPIIIESIFKMLSIILDILVKYVPKIVDAGIELILGFLKGITSHIKEITSTAIQIMVNFIEGVASMLPQIIQAGFDLIISFINGLADAIDKNTPLVVSAVGKLIDSIIRAAGTIMTGCFDIGVNIVKGIINGINSFISHVADSAANLGNSVIESAKKALGIHSPSRMFKEIGENIVKGMTNGIDNTSNQAVAASSDMSTNVVQASNQSAKDAFDKAVEWIDERKYYNKLSLSEELAAWQDLQNKYIEGTEERKRADREVYRVQKELYKADYDAATKYIDDKKYYNEMSLYQELEAWKKIQSQYAEGSDERQKADKEVYRIRKEMTQSIIETRHSEFEAEMKDIDDKKYYNKMSLQEELDALKKIQKGYIQSSSDREKVDREVYRVEQEINKANEEYTKRKSEIEKGANDKRIQMTDEYYAKTKEINSKLEQDVNSLYDKYDDAVKSRADSIYNSYGIFDKIESPKVVNGDQLIRNLKGQVTSLESWQRNINELSAKGIDQELLKELENMGPKSAAQIQALNKMSADKLNTYVSLWKTKHQDARIQAVSELESLRIETRDQIAQLSAQAAIELRKYEATYEQNIRSINEDTKAQLGELKVTWANNMKMTTTDATTQVVTMTSDIKTSVIDMRKETEGEIKSLATNIKDIISNTDWYSVGTSIIGGITLGITDTSNMLKDQIKLVARTALESAKSVLGIHSPSKEFRQIGAYSIQGFVEGLGGYSGLVDNSVMSIGNNAINSLRDVISNIGSIINSDIDMNPTIRPVMDLSDITSGVGTINSLFNKSQGITVNGIANKASYIMGNLGYATKTNQNGSSQQSIQSSESSPIYVTVISELDGREIARVTAPAMSEELYNLNRRKMR